VLELQNKLPKARVVYASATGSYKYPRRLAASMRVKLNLLKDEILYHPGASEPRNMAYMNRLGIWGHKTPFREFGNFIQAVERR